MAAQNNMKTNYDKDIARIDAELSNLKRIFDTVERVTLNVERLATETKNMRESMNDLSTRVKDLENKPIKRYDAIIQYICTAVIGIVIGAIAMIIGLK